MLDLIAMRSNHQLSLVAAAVALTAAGIGVAPASAASPYAGTNTVVSSQPTGDLAFDSAGRLWALQGSGLRCVKLVGSTCPRGPRGTAGVQGSAVLPSPDGGLVVVGTRGAASRAAAAWVPAVGGARARALPGGPLVAGLSAGRAGEPLLSFGDETGGTKVLSLGGGRVRTVASLKTGRFGAVTLGSDGALLSGAVDDFGLVRPRRVLPVAGVLPQLPGSVPQYGSAAAAGGAWLAGDAGRVVRLTRTGAAETVALEGPVGDPSQLAEVETADSSCDFQGGARDERDAVARIVASAVAADGATWVLSECSISAADRRTGTLTRIAPIGATPRVQTFWLPALVNGWAGTRFVAGPDGRLYFAGGEGIHAFGVGPASAPLEARVVSARRTGRAVVVTLRCEGPVGRVCAGTVKLRRGSKGVRSGRYFLPAGPAAVRPTVQRPFAAKGLPRGALRAAVGTQSVAVK